MPANSQTSHCHRCGAEVPLELQAVGGACAYCGAPIAGNPKLARRQRKIAEEQLQLEAERRAVATQVAHREVELAVETARRGRSGFSGLRLQLKWLLWVAFLMFGGRFVVGKLAPIVDRAFFAHWSGTTPLTCAGNDALLIEGKDVSLLDLSIDQDHTAAAAIVATGHCHLTIKHTKLRSKVAILAQEDAIVTIEGGLVDATESAIVAQGHARVEARDAQIVARPGQIGAIQAGDSASIRLEGGRVDGQAQTALWLDGQARAELREVELVAKKKADDAGNWNGTAIGAQGEAHAEVHGGTLVGGLTAIHLEGNARVALHETKVDGNVYVLKADHLTGLPEPRGASRSH